MTLVFYRLMEQKHYPILLITKWMRKNLCDCIFRKITPTSWRFSSAIKAPMLGKCWVTTQVQVTG